jgi:hypothetical protein
MRAILVVLVGLAGGLAFAAGVAAPAKRYGIEADLKTYSQATPQEALASVVKAIEGKHIDYLVAQLADPAFVDRRVRDTGGKFDDLVKEAMGRLVGDPGAARQLRRLQKDGEWDVQADRASVRVKDGKDGKDRRAYFRKEGDRWFLENRYK